MPDISAAGTSSQQKAPVKRIHRMRDSDPAPPVARPSFGRAVTVLLVDDQGGVGDAVRRALAAETEIEFCHCTEPAAALVAAKEAKPTVILQDLAMPGIDGLDLVRRYREDLATASIPIIVLSTREDPAVKSDAFKAGANDYLVKLPDRVELVARIRYHSNAYRYQLQRDEAYRELHESRQQLLEKNIELQRLTNVDGLTGLSNRRYLDEYLTAEWKRAIRTQKPLSILMVDVDHFKQYNDTYGHLSGDEILRRVARAIGDNFSRSTDLAARFGGEEFVVVLADTPYSGALYLGDKVCRAVEALRLPHIASGVGKFLTVSVGGATRVPRPGDRFSLLVDAADKALYAAKRAGRNRAVAHDMVS
jgi:two-component system, chemotaxis family, response regulator WspR